MQRATNVYSGAPAGSRRPFPSFEVVNPPAGWHSPTHVGKAEPHTQHTQTLRHKCGACTAVGQNTSQGKEGRSHFSHARLFQSFGRFPTWHCFMVIKVSSLFLTFLERFASPN